MCDMSSRADAINNNKSIVHFRCIQLGSAFHIYIAMGIRKKYDNNLKVRYGGITTAKIGNYLTQLLLFCFLLLGCLYTCLFVFYLYFKSYYFQPKRKHFFLLSDPFVKLLMPKVERVYNLQIDMVMKRKELYQLKMFFSELTNMSLFR